MKNFHITIALLALTRSVLAQGTVNFIGVPGGEITVQTNSTQYSPFFGGGSNPSGSIGYIRGAVTNGTGFYFSLVYQSFTGVQALQPTTLSQLSAWSDSGLGGVNYSPTFGTIECLPQNNMATVPWATGTTDSTMIVIWSQNLGSTFASALANMENQDYSSPAFFGETTTGYIAPSPSGSPGADVFGNGSQSPNGLPINSHNTQLYLLPAPVPEPATVALAAGGTLALLILRRRKP